MKIKKYNHKKIEKKIQKYWIKNKIFKSKINNKKKKYYCLCMIPYPSGKLHMGHIRNYTIGDIISRYKRLNNKNVLNPIGWDSFGLPAENAAINSNLSPNEWTKKNIKYMKKQLKLIGISYDWKKEINTCKSNFYKWEQWLFIKLFNKKMIYKKKKIVNWCSKDKTVLANEQVIKEKCWRCNNKIKYKYISQWFIKITKYSNFLIKNLKKLKKWPKKVINMQKNWIGKYNGFKIKFFIKKINKYIYIFTHKIELITSTTYICLSIKNKLIKKIKKLKKIYKKYIKKNNKKKKYYILKTNLYTKNPITKKKIPIIITNFTEKLYNSKQIILTPSNIKSQYKFAKKFKLKIIKIIKNKKLINSGIINNIKIKKIKKKIIKILKKKIKKHTIFKLKDWTISRQRYWGVPIPIIKKNNIYYPNKKLPVKLPKNIKINKKNINPLIKNKKWKYIKKNNIKIKKETDTIDTFLSSSWYHTRIISPNYNKNIIEKKKSDYWLPIDLYIGGIEHATMHLIYLRFINKFLYKLKLIKYKEPVKRLICQGMILSKTFFYKKNKQKKWINIKNIIKKKKNNKIIYIHKYKKINIKYGGIKKMSKSKNNGIEPNKIIKKYGSDTLRLFIIFSAPIEKNLIWNDKNIKGCYRFLNKIWNLSINFINKKISNINKKNNYNLLKKNLNKTIYNVTKNIKLYKLNISISNIMKFLKKLKNFNFLKNKKNFKLYKKCICKIIILLYPFTPHISFYLYKKIKNKKIDFINWPKYTKKINNNKNIKLIIQINGKKKYILNIKKNTNKKNIIKKIYNINIIKKYILNKKIKKIFYIKNKLINFII